MPSLARQSFLWFFLYLLISLRAKKYLKTSKVFRQSSDIYIDMVAASHSNSSYRATKEGGFFLCGNNASDGASAVLQAARRANISADIVNFCLKLYNIAGRIALRLVTRGRNFIG